MKTENTPKMQNYPDMQSVWEAYKKTLLKQDPDMPPTVLEMIEQWFKAGFITSHKMMARLIYEITHYTEDVDRKKKYLDYMARNRQLIIEHEKIMKITIEDKNET